MQLLETIVNELIDTNISMTSILLKTKLLASRINNQELLFWVSNELDGYKDKKDLPKYRVTSGNIIGDYINGNTRVSNHILPLPDLGSEFDREIRSFEFYDGIGSLEKLNVSSSQNLTKPFPFGQVKVLDNLLREHAVHSGHFSLTNAGLSTSSGFLKLLLSSVRNKLLDFMISLEKEFGLEVNIETLKSNNNRITTIMNTTINNNGDGNLNNTGNDAIINNNVILTKKNQEVLKKTLSDNDVNKDDIEYLLKIIDTEIPKSSTDFGTEVNKWIYNMMGKAVDGTWKIGIGAAGGILAKAISYYYGVGQ